MLEFTAAPTPLQRIEDPFLDKYGVKLYLKRDDLIHPEVSGNKWRKLKYNLVEAKLQGHTKLLTFGGAYSNHIAATAAAGKLFGLQTIGIIRGEELNLHSNSRLRTASENGMELIFVSREEYKDKEALAQQHGDGCYVLPEGGSNALAARGAAETMSEIVEELGKSPQFVATPIGTGGTFAGLCAQAPAETRVLGFTVLKNGQYLLPEINAMIVGTGRDLSVTGDLSLLLPNYEIFWDFHCGGYAKTTPDLIAFMARFQQQTNIKIEPIYSGKMLYWLYELIKRNDYFVANDNIVAVHTGGV